MSNLEQAGTADREGNATVTETQELSRLAEIAGALAAESTALELRELLTRISEGRFFVACVGQFKRGKSTLLDALVGEPILPTGVVPVTAVPTLLRYGAEKSARVLMNGQWKAIDPQELAQYVSEELNPENRKRVEGVEVFLPSALLASGMCLVDTPGIGSVFTGNTEATKQFIPQIDAALLVVGADPPISGEELALTEAVAVNVDNILVVLNKIDRVSGAERKEAAEFAARVLQARLKRPIGRIYELSALGKMNGSGLADDWDAFARDLHQLANQSGRELTHAAAARGLQRCSASLQRLLAERVRALQEPVAHSERRIATLRQTVAEAEQSLRDLGALFAAEQMRLSNTLLARRKQFLRGVSVAAAEEFAREARSIKTRFGPALRRQLMAAAQSVVRRHVMPWLDEEEAHAEQLYAAVMSRFAALVNALLARISQEQGSEFAHLPKALEAEQGFRSRSRFYFHDMITIAQPGSPLLYASDVVMGTFHVRSWFSKPARRFLEQLLDTNAARVQGDAEQRVVESRLQLETEVRKLLREVSTTAEQALSDAREVVASGGSAVAAELERLNNLGREIDSVSRTGE